MSNFWDILYLIISTFLFVTYLIILFHVVVDLFRDAQLNGFFKVIWLIGLIVLPFLTALIYVLARGKGMAERQLRAINQARSDTEAYIRQVAAKSPAEQIADAKALLDSGTLTQQEYDQLKAKALA
jgi:uncharacterized membrane protein